MVFQIMAISRLTHNRKMAIPLRLTFRSPILLLNLLIRISLFLRSSFMRRILPVCSRIIGNLTVTSR
ncbi:hypothetical protein CFIO01_05108 [Colletotrichum fioriniae PJ7]|uniref:Uncharacterized protein n=1 Tax=Colletotrichum fioriniae PJ7 TaxID=1445577 RepID=A0A010RG79_9PEZI|nr:hypothetical protein CFIO01_05108 [Colletotrichum fioriniae PJ7]